MEKVFRIGPCQKSQALHTRMSIEMGVEEGAQNHPIADGALTPGVKSYGAMEPQWSMALRAAHI